jgi:tetrahydromethanopterin S-methyltransferase subunit G
MVSEERHNELGNKVSRLEGVVEQINLRLSEIHSRMNTQIGLTFAMWATITGILLAMLLKS